jgi:hypothetical protein
MERDEDFERYFRNWFHEYFSTEDEYQTIRQAYDYFTETKIFRYEGLFPYCIKDRRDPRSKYRRAREIIAELFEITETLSDQGAALQTIDAALDTLAYLHTENDIKKIFRAKARRLLEGSHLKPYQIRKLLEGEFTGFYEYYEVGDSGVRT